MTASPPRKVLLLVSFAGNELAFGEASRLSQKSFTTLMKQMDLLGVPYEAVVEHEKFITVKAARAAMKKLCEGYTGPITVYIICDGDREDGGSRFCLCLFANPGYKTQRHPAQVKRDGQQVDNPDYAGLTFRYPWRMPYELAIRAIIRGEAQSRKITIVLPVCSSGSVARERHTLGENVEIVAFCERYEEVNQKDVFTFNDMICDPSSLSASDRWSGRSVMGTWLSAMASKFDSKVYNPKLLSGNVVEFGNGVVTEQGLSHLESIDAMTWASRMRHDWGFGEEDQVRDAISTIRQHMEGYPGISRATPSMGSRQMGTFHVLKEYASLDLADGGDRVTAL